MVGIVVVGVVVLLVILLVVVIVIIQASVWVHCAGTKHASKGQSLNPGQPGVPPSTLVASSNR